MARGRRLLLLAALTCLGTASRAAEKYIEDSDRFPGWKGELPEAVPSQRITDALNQSSGQRVAYGTPGGVGLFCHCLPSSLERCFCAQGGL